MRINDLVRDFQEKGHSVTVLTALPNYPEGTIYSEFIEDKDSFSKYFGAEVIRVPIIPRGKRKIQLAFNYLSFLLSASLFGPFKLRGKKFDGIFVYGVSPITVAIPAIVLSKIKKVPTYLWVLDLWPETLSAVGVVKNRFILKAVGAMVSWIYNRSSFILGQSRSFVSSIAKYCEKKDPSSLIYFPSWAEDNFSEDVALEKSPFNIDPSFFNIVFAGNIGDAQDFPSILDTAELLNSKGIKNIRWIIVGDGRAREWVEREVERRKIKNFFLLGRFPIETMPTLFKESSALLVSLKDDPIFSKTIPGKLQAYMAFGRPLLGMISGEANTIINESKAGFSCQSGDSQKLEENIISMLDLSDEELIEMSYYSRKYYEQNFSKRELLDRLESLIFENK